MTPIDWTAAYETYRGQWVAFRADHETVVASGDSLESVKAAANRIGYPNAIITRMPSTLRNFIG